MKFNSIVIGALTVVSMTAAQAQSSVTVFGVLDAGVRYAKNGSNHQYMLASGGTAISRLGFRGTEDLGGGLKAGFWLESQVNVDDGSIAASGKFWHRRSTVSLMSDSLGEIRIGRDFAPTYLVVIGVDPFQDTGVGAISNVISQASINGSAYATHTRVDNMVTYLLPNTLGGVYGRVSVAAGEGTLGRRLVGGSLGYKNGPVDVSGAYSRTQAGPGGDVSYGAGAFSYDFGVAKLMTGLSQLKAGSAKENHFNLSALVPIGVTTVRASWVHSVGKGGLFEAVDRAQNKADMFAVGALYSLSTRTMLYSNISTLKNKGGATFVVSGGPALGTGTRSTAVDFGLRHAF
jgi:predicted porin